MEEFRDLLKDPKSRLVGFNQVEKGIVTGMLNCVIIASDTDDNIRSKLTLLCTKNEIQIVTGPTMKELGLLCGIHVPASVTGILKRQY